MSVNSDLLDRGLDNAAMARLFEEQLQRDVGSIYTRHSNRLKRILERGGPTRAILRKVDREVGRTVREAFGMLDTQFTQYIRTHADFVAGSLDKSLGDIWRTRNAPRVALRNLVANQPIRDSLVLSKHFENIGVGEIDRIEAGLRRGIGEGLNERQIASRLLADGTLRTTRAQSRALIRTALTSYATTTSNMVYAENADVLEGYIYVATLDARTTPICARNDNRSFKFTDSYQPMPPLHWNCRSTTIPWVKDVNDINPESNQVKQRGLRNLLPRQRASIDGAVPAGVSYGGWLQKQTYAVQLRHLGAPGRVELFRQGNLKLSRFSNSAGRFISISTLQNINAIVTRQAGGTAALRAVTGRGEALDNANPSEFQRVQAEDRNVTRGSDIYDGPDARQFHNSFLDVAVYQAERGAATYLDYNGLSKEARRRSYNRLVTEPDSLRYSSITQDYEHTALVNLEGYDLVQARYLQAIDDDILGQDFNPGNNKPIPGGLTLEDMIYLREVFWPAIKNRVSAPQALAFLNAARRTFRAGNLSSNPDYFSTPGNDFGNVFRRILNAEDQGSINSVSSALRDAARMGPTGIIQQLENSQINIFGLGATSIDTIRAQAPEAIQRILNFKSAAVIGREIKDHINGRTDIPNDIREILDLVTPEEFNGLLDQYIRNRSANLDLDLASDSIGRNIWKAKREIVFPLNAKAGASREIWLTGTYLFDALRASGRLRTLARTKRVKSKLDSEWGPAGTYVTERRQYLVWDDPNIKSTIVDRDIVNVDINLGTIGTTSRYTARAGETTFAAPYTFVNQRTSSLTSRQNELHEVTAGDLQANLNTSIALDPQGVLPAILKIIQDRPVGNAAENILVQVIKERNDWNTLASIMHHYNLSLENGEALSLQNLFQVHEGGRIQGIGYTTNNKGEFWRGLYSQSTPMAFGSDGLDVLLQRFSQIIDKVGTPGIPSRRAFFLNNQTELFGLASDVYKLAKTPSANPKAIIARVLGHPLIRNASSDDVPEFLKLLFEIEDIRIKTGGTRLKPFRNADQISALETRIALEVDVTESGTQAQALFLKDRGIALKVNLFPVREVSRLRDLITDLVISNERIRTSLPNLSKSDILKLIKTDVTTGGYGSGDLQRAKALLSGDSRNNGLRQILDDLIKDDMTWVRITNKNRDIVINMIDDLLGVAIRLRGGRPIRTRVAQPAELTDIERKALQRIRDDFADSFDNDLPNRAELEITGRFIDVETQNIINKLTENSPNVINQNSLRVFTDVVQQTYDAELPALRRLREVFGDLVESYLLRPDGNGDGQIPVLNDRGAINILTFLNKKRVNVKRVEADGRETNTTIYTDDDSTVDTQSARSAIAPLFTHSVDSGLAGSIARRGNAQNYDGFITSPSDVNALKEFIRMRNGEIVDSNLVSDWLDLLEDRGFPLGDYSIFGRDEPLLGLNSIRRLLFEGDGVNPPLIGDLIGRELTQPIQPGFNFQGAE